MKESTRDAARKVCISGAFLIVAASAPMAVRAAAPPGTATIIVLGAFSGSDGAGGASLTEGADGTLYGATESGGDYNAGTVFAMGVDGTRTIVHAFRGVDGAHPGMLSATANHGLYGVTRSGGPADAGTIFHISAAGAFATLHAFNGSDGALPRAIVVTPNGTVYGITANGGETSGGVAFRLTSSGQFAVLHEFSAQTDGAHPEALIQTADDTLYGTAADLGPRGNGTVFRLMTSGALAVLHAFGGSDGAQPNGLLAHADGSLDGVTASGGALNRGTIFRLAADGSFVTRHSFSSTDGARPSGALIAANAGSILGLTREGGAANAGTVFTLDANGTVAVLHTFAGGTEGAAPQALMRGSRGDVFGVTRGGGVNGSGVLFRLAALGVTVTSPNGGEKVFTGTPYVITWSATAGDNPIDHFDVAYSTNSGSTWNPLTGCLGVSGTARSCVWSAPGPVSKTAEIRVTATDTVGNTMADASDHVFTIASGTATLTVSAPNTAVNWGIGSHQTISWKHNAGATATFKIEVSRDGGATYPETIAAAAPATGASAGNFVWQVTGPATTIARVRVTWVNGPSASDASNVNFAIAAAFLTVTSPKASSNWGYNTSQKPTWTTNLGASDTVDVKLSTDAGSSYPITLASGIAASTKSATVTTPTLGASTTTARVEVVWTNPPSGGLTGVDPTNFKIGPAFISVKSPNGGDTWLGGSAQTITWTTNLGSLENVVIELSRDNGGTYPITIAASTPSDGSQAITVPDTTWDAAAARVRITWLKDSSVSDTSNASFTILTPTVTVVSPNGGESWSTGTTQNVTWSSNLPSSGFVKIELSLDGGGTYPVLLAASAPNTGSTSVTVQNSWVTSTARVRITSLTYSSAVDTSDANFAIVTGPFITVTSPNGGETWADGSSQTITWNTNLPPADSVKIELSQDGGATFPITLLASTMNSGSASVTVLHSWDSTSARVRITSISDPTVADASDANFTIGSTSPSVSIVDFSFSPGTLTVPVGTTVTWTNKGMATHTTTSDTGAWDSGFLSPGSTFTFTFSTTGTFTYHCNVHRTMTGTIIVE